MSEYQIQNGDPKCVRGRRLGGQLGRLVPLPLQTLRPRDQSKGPRQGWAPCDPHRVLPAQEVVAALKKEKEKKKQVFVIITLCRKGNRVRSGLSCPSNSFTRDQNGPSAPHPSIWPQEPENAHVTAPRSRHARVTPHGPSLQPRTGPACCTKRARAAPARGPRFALQRCRPSGPQQPESRRPNAPQIGPLRALVCCRQRPNGPELPEPSALAAI